MNKVAKNYLYNLSYQILIIIVPIFTTPYVSRVLGAKGVGTFSYVNSIVQYFILFGCIGLNLYGQREIAYVQHDKEKRNKVFWELITLRIMTVSISLIVYFSTAVAYGQYAPYFVIMSLDIVAAMFDISWFFQGIEDFKKIVVRNFMIKLTGVALIFLFVKSFDDLWLYTICHSCALLFGNLSMWLYMPKLIGKVAVKELEIKRHIKPTIILFLPQIAASVYNVLDKTMIGYLTGIEEEVAYYEQGQKIVKIVMALVTSLGTIMLPRVANLFKLEKTEKIKECLSKSFQFEFLLSFPMMLGLMAISSNIVPWFFGEGYDKVIPNMMIISPIICIIAISNIIGNQYLIPTGRQKQYTISVVVGCAVNCCLNLILIPKYLSLGAAVATVIAELSVTGTQIYFTRNDFNFKNIILSNWKYILSSVIMFIPVYILSKALTAAFFHSIVIVVVGSVIYFSLLLILKDEFLLEIIEKLKIKIIN